MKLTFMVAFTKNTEVPTGVKHLDFVMALNEQSRGDTVALLDKPSISLELLGTSLAAIFISSTCHRGCRGGDHTIEAIGGRIYNLAIGAYSLIYIGLYDESQNLIRSIGEIGNILSLSVEHPDIFDEWSRSTKQERIKKFGPAKIRGYLTTSKILMMDSDWYSDLCESFTHITPNVTPNHYDLGRNTCGGFVQEKGIDSSLQQLIQIVVSVAIYYCRYSKLEDLDAEIGGMLRIIATES